MEIAVGPVEAIPEGGVKIVQSGSLFVGVYRIDGALYAIEGRCSHDDGPLCGDELAVELEISDDVVRDVRFNGRGCAISQAAASMISDVVKGKTVAEVAALGRDDILDELGIPLTPIRLKCAMLSVSVLKVALGRTPGEDDREIEWRSR